MIILKKNKRYIVLEESPCIRYLQRRVEELAYEYLISMQVQPEKYYRKSLSHKFGKHPYGHFMVSGADKVQVYHKWLNRGYVYNSDIINKLATFILIRPSANHPEYEEREYDPIDLKPMLEELISRFEKTVN